MKSTSPSVLLINNSYPTPRYPQASTYIATIEKCLSKAGFSVHLLVMKRNSLSRMVKFLQHFIFVFRVFLRNFRMFDVIYVNHYAFVLFPLILKLCFRKNGVFIHWHGEDLVGKSFRVRVSRLLILYLSRETHNYIVPSEYFGELLRKRLKNRRNNVFISPSGGVNSDLFVPLERRMHLDRRRVTIGFSSGLVFSKGVDFVFKLKENRHLLEQRTGKQVFFHIINYGKEKKYWIQKISKEDVGVFKVFEPIPKDKMFEFYNTIDLLVFPTRRKEESLGLVALEAMSCGVPVIGPRLFALPEYIIPGDSGEMYKGDCFDSFFEKVVKAISHLSEYSPRKIVLERYSQDFVVEQYKQILF